MWLSTHLLKIGMLALTPEGCWFRMATAYRNNGNGNNGYLRTAKLAAEGATDLE